MNTSLKPVESNFLRKHPTYTDGEPMKGKIEFDDPTFRENKIGGKNRSHHTEILRLMRELESERKRSARWKAIAKCYHESYYALEEFVTELLEVEQ